MPHTLQIFTARSGHPSARVVLATGELRHLHSAVHPEAESSYLPATEIWAEVVVLLGLGLGHQLEALGPALVGRTVIGVDFFPELVSGRAATLVEGSANRVFLLSGDDIATGKLEAVLRGLDPGARMQIVRHAASCAVVPEFYADVLGRVHAAGKAHRAHRDRRPAESVLVLRGAFFLEGECLQALDALGIPAVELRYDMATDARAWEDRLAKAVEEHRPRLLLSINMKGFDGQGVLIETARLLGIPVAIWFVDDPHPILLPHRSYLHDGVTAFCWERSYLAYLRAAGFGRVVHLPLAGAPPPVLPSPAMAIDHPLAFVGTAMAGEFLASVRSRFLWTDTLAPLADAVAESLCADRRAPVPATLHKIATALGLTLPFSDERNVTWLCSYIVHLATAKTRAAMAERLVPLGLTIYGDQQGWRELMGPGAPVKPPLDYHRELPAVYRATAINVNTTSHQMRTAVNQRVFDAPLAGGFVISDDQEDARNLFEAGTEAVLYRDLDELVEQVERYVARPDERWTIVEAARRHILAEHTYSHRLRFILDQTR